MADVPTDRLRPGDPRQVGPWRIERRLGSGGMGVVYLGVREDGQLGAVKLVAEHVLAEPTFPERFKREIAALQRAAGPNVAGMIDADPTAQAPYLVTQLVDGLSLQEVVDAQGPLAVDRWTAMAVGLLAALERVHAAGIVHRDLKPTNVIVAGDEPWLIDFGMAALQDAATLTATRSLIGTLGWMPPERLRGAAASPAGDVYALAAVLAFAGTGRPPFGADGPVTTLTRVLAGDADLVGLSAAQASLVVPMMAEDPQARPTATDALRSWRSARTPTSEPGRTRTPRHGSPTAG